MNTKHAGSPKHNMTSRLSRLAAGGALVAAALTTVAPAMAYQPRDPAPPGSHVPTENPGTPTVPTLPPAPTPQPLPSQPPASAEVTDSVDLSSAGLGALAGIALAGAGLGVTLGIQRRRDHSV